MILKILGAAIFWHHVHFIFQVGRDMRPVACPL